MKKHALALTLSLSVLIGIQLPDRAHASTHGGRAGLCANAFDENPVHVGTVELETVRKRSVADYWAKLVSTLESAQPESSIGADRIESWVVAHFFFDRLEVAGSANREYSSLIELWDKTHEASPFLPFKKTFEKSIEASKSKVNLTFDVIADIHRTMMDGKPKIEDAKKGNISWFELIKERALFQWSNVEDIATRDIGKIRTESVGFRLAARPKGAGLPKYKNPLVYASVREETGVTGLKTNNDWALYACLEGVDRFKDQLSVRVQAEVEAARKAGTLTNENSELTKVVIEDLLNSAISAHTQEIAKAKNLDERVEAHARFVWKFISIHPFKNGNGRTGRALLSRLLMADGLIPPLLKNQNDVIISATGYIEQVKEGIILSSKFTDDLIWRAQNGWEPSKSPIPLSARLPKKIYFDSKQDDIGDRYAEVDIYDYAQFLRMAASNTNVKGETAMLRDYVAHLKRWTAYRAKTGEEYQVRFVPAEMQTAALQIDATSKSKWNLKKTLFYSSDLAWRGLSVTESQSLDQLLSLFVKPEGILLSMNSSNARTQEEIERSVQQDFETFNRKILNPNDYFKMANDHMKAEGDYYRSPLLSAAMTRAVADRFSKGFLTGAENILNQKGRLVVAALAPEFGTSYFNRLGPISKRMELGFLSKYPRQQEIAIAGIMAPDSVMRVEYRDVKVLNVAENTGENIAGDTEVKSVTLLERDPLEPSVITVTVSSEDGVVKSVRKFKIVKSESGITFQIAN